MQTDLRKEFVKPTFRALALRRSEKRNCGLCLIYIQKMELCYWWERSNMKNKNE